MDKMGRCESVPCCRVLLCYNFVTFKRIASKGLDTMLVASIENAEAHDYLSERLKKAYAFLRENDLGALSCGRHDIDGEDVFANVMEEYDEADDYALFESPMPATSVVLHAGEIAVLPPEDAHKPGCIAEDAPVHVKKVVVKVRA